MPTDSEAEALKAEREHMAEGLERLGAIAQPELIARVDKWLDDEDQPGPDWWIDPAGKKLIRKILPFLYAELVDVVRGS